MNRKKIPGLLDVIIVDEPEQIRALSNDNRIDRVFRMNPLLNALFLRRRLSVLSYKKEPFPHLSAFGRPGRFTRQQVLWNRFTEIAPTIAMGPSELEPLAEWIKGKTPSVEPGILVQQIIGSAFSVGYIATPDTWAAAVTLITASASVNYPRLLWWMLSGKIARARTLLGKVAEHDILCMHGTAVAVHNIVAAVKRMKTLYADEKIRKSINAETAADICLFPPPVLLRQALSDGNAGGCPFSKYSLLLFKLNKVKDRPDAKDLVFMTESWSRCPAEKWVPAFLTGLWKRSCNAGTNYSPSAATQNPV